MTRQEQKNEKAILRGVNRLKANKEAMCEQGLYAMLMAGLDYLEEAHGLLHPGERHIGENDTLGWAIIHDGKIVEVVSQSKGAWTPRGDALGRLEQMASSLRSGWCGIIMSDVANSWYRLDWENDYLNYSAMNVKDRFHTYFKSIK